jgi:hypothetical protein
MDMLISYFLLFGAMCLMTLCDFAMGPIKEQHTIFCKSQKKCDGFPSNDLTSIQGRKHEPYTGVLMTCSVQGRLRVVRQVKSKVKSMLILFFDIKGIVHKEFILAGQTINSAYYCDVLR